MLISLLKLLENGEDTEDKINVQNYIEQNNLTEKIKFLGLIHNEEKWEVL